MFREMRAVIGQKEFIILLISINLRAQSKFSIIIQQAPVVRRLDSGIHGN